MTALPSPFCLIGTPRSRTAWFARFLTHGAVRCEHEPSKFWRSDDDITEFFRPGVGAADSMLTLKWRELQERGVKMLAIVRPRGDVMQSALAAGIPGVASALDHILAQIDTLPPNVPRYDYRALTPKICREIFEQCVGVPCSAVWSATLCGTAVEADFASVLGEAKANSDGLRAFYGDLFEVKKKGTI